MFQVNLNKITKQIWPFIFVFVFSYYLVVSVKFSALQFCWNLIVKTSPLLNFVYRFYRRCRRPRLFGTNTSYCGLVKIVYLRLYAFSVGLFGSFRISSSFLYNVCKFVSCQANVLSVDSRNGKKNPEVMFGCHFPARNLVMPVNNSR